MRPEKVQSRAECIIMCAMRKELGMATLDLLPRGLECTKWTCSRKSLLPICGCRHRSTKVLGLTWIWGREGSLRQCCDSRRERLLSTCVGDWAAPVGFKCSSLA